jgi:hypothetical protein
MCAALSSYVRACATKGIMLWGWRERICSECLPSLLYPWDRGPGRELHGLGLGALSMGGPGEDRPPQLAPSFFCQVQQETSPSCSLLEVILQGLGVWGRLELWQLSLGCGSEDSCCPWPLAVQVSSVLAEWGLRDPIPLILILAPLLPPQTRMWVRAPTRRSSCTT